jgi:Nucleoside 2-deoxyribosyltransferase like
MARILKPPAPLVVGQSERSVFLAGSIDDGRAEPWQAEVERLLADAPVVILNPRRDLWDATWSGSDDHPGLRAQIEWELDALEHASVIAMYFAPATKAPITLLELGLFARTGKPVVCCPQGYWRRGNVDVVCARFGLTRVPDLPSLVAHVCRRLEVL